MGRQSRPRLARSVRRGGGRRAALNRGDIFEAELPERRRPVVILTRDWAIPVLANVTVAAITTAVRGLPTEVPLGRQHGLAEECVVNCDNLLTLPKSALGPRRGVLDPESLTQLRSALILALDLER